MTVSRDLELSVKLSEEKASLLKRIKEIEDLQKKTIKTKSLKNLDRKVKAELIRMGLDEIASGLTFEMYGDDWHFYYATAKYTLKIKYDGDCFCAYFDFYRDAERYLDNYVYEDEDLSECLMGLYKELVEDKRERERNIKLELLDLEQIQRAYDILDKNLKSEFKPV